MFIIGTFFINYYLKSMSVTHRKHNEAPAFNCEAQVKELNAKFNHLVKQLGTSNKAGTSRYEFEVDFAYALHEIKSCPAYRQEHRFYNATSIFNNLLKKLQEEKIST